MQQMHEPEGQEYNAGYQAESDYSQPEQEQAEPLYQPYEGTAFQQQKLQPPRKGSLTLAIFSIVASSIIMGCAITLFVLALVTFIAAMHGTVPDYIRGLTITSFVFSIILFACSIPAFVFSIIQATLIGKQFPHGRKNMNRS
jgi:ABC-type dipeptide/oligopeptide/nickel transport system permease subunit